MRIRYGQERRSCGGEATVKVYAIRGATTVDANTEEEISAKSVELIKRIKEKNGLGGAVSIAISTTKDITASYPAKAVRESGVLDAPLFSCVEPDIDGALPMCIRMLVTVCTDDDGAEAKHVYMEGARVLRREFADEGI